jgi:hypothetical protein
MVEHGNEYQVQYNENGNAWVKPKHPGKNQGARLMEYSAGKAAGVFLVSENHKRLRRRLKA